MSKWCGAGGWRLGCALMPRSLEGTLKSAIIGILSETVSGTPTPVQYAALKAYEANEEMEMYLQHQRRILALVGGKVHEILTEVGIRVVNPTGEHIQSFSLFLSFSLSYYYSDDDAHTNHPCLLPLFNHIPYPLLSTL